MVKILGTFFKKEIFVLFGILGVELYGLFFSVSMFSLLIFLSLADTVVGYYIARQKGIVSSRIGSDGLMKKVMWIFMLGGAIVFLGNMSYMTDHSGLETMLSLSMITLIMFRLVFEIVSFVENIAIISSTEEQETLSRISNTLLKIVGIGRKQIQKKIEKYK